ncbi:Pentapeptide repeat family protein [Alloactinosynnema sp. L-07]|nr:Pentapeptide repeat family protein [Alloactinosynnema sp. L-07]
MRRLLAWRGWASAPATVGVVVLLAGLYFTAQTLIATQAQSKATQDQVRLAERGQNTDRFGRAIDQLGAEKIDVRLGGVYALEQLARDQPGFVDMAEDVFSAFIRTHAPAHMPCASGTAVDVQGALTAVGRLRQPRETWSYRLEVDLSDTCLAGADLRGAMLQQVDLNGADLSGAELHGAILRRADLSGVRLDGAGLRDVDLESAQLSPVSAQGGDFGGANLRDARLGGSLAGAAFYGTVMTNATGQTVDFTGATFNDTRADALRLARGNFTGITAWSADFSNSYLGGSVFAGANFADVTLRGADLTGAVITAVTFCAYRGDPEDPTCVETSADLSGAVLRNADLTGTPRRLLRLDGADLTEVTGLG